MSSKVVVKCSSGHSFPVNLEKHTDRDYVLCPKCREKVRVKKEHFFSPSPKWKEEKKIRAGVKQTEKEMKKRRPRMPFIGEPALAFKNPMGELLFREHQREMLENQRKLLERKKEEEKKDEQK